MNVLEKYDERAARSDSLLCVGLDSSLERFLDEASPQFSFNRYIIEQTHTYVSAYKPNSAYYEAEGARGMVALRLTLAYLRAEHPDILTILDAKRGDNATSNRAYATAAFDRLGADAVTLQPYMGREMLRPFLDRKDKGCIVLCRTSNLDQGILQESQVVAVGRGAPQPLWQVVAEQVRDEWNAHGNCMFVVGATQPQALHWVREHAQHIPVLAPGLGAQGADLDLAVRAGIDQKGRGLILSASRSVIFSRDPGSEARGLRDAINRARSAETRKACCH